jgi:hypothetical protein
MSCSNCDCSDCEHSRSYNDEEEEYEQSPLPTLPKYPPFPFVQADYQRGLDHVFDEKYPGARINGAAASMMVIQFLEVGPGHFKQAEEEIRDYMLQLVKDGKLECRKGKAGGYCKPIAQVHMTEQECNKAMAGKSQGQIKDLIYGFSAPQVQTASAEPTINDYTCPCGNDRCSKAEKSCWKCGAAILA